MYPMESELKGVRYILLFVAATVAGVFLHEVGHAIAGLSNGVIVVPTPAKEYVLGGQLLWTTSIWISLGGVLATTIVAMAGVLYFSIRPCSRSEAIMAGVLLPLGLYSARFLFVGRGHDEIEWQGAQAALGLSPSGHAIDIHFLSLLVIGLAAWVWRRHPAPSSLWRVVALSAVGVTVLVLLQVGNNAVFDPLFPRTETANVPPGLHPR